MNLANRITFFRLLLIPVFMLFSTALPGYMDESLNLSIFTTYGVYIAAVIFAIAALTDKLDGYVARKYKQVTKLGIFLDPLVDKLLVTGALFFLVQINRTSWLVALAIIGRELAVTGLRLTAAQKGFVLAADKLGKAKMVLQVVAILLAMLSNYPISLFTSFRVDVILMYMAAIVTVYSGIHYFKVNWHVFKEDSRGNEIGDNLTHG